MNIEVKEKFRGVPFELECDGFTVKVVCSDLWNRGYGGFGGHRIYTTDDVSRTTVSEYFDLSRPSDEARRMVWAAAVRILRMAKAARFEVLEGRLGFGVIK